MDDMTELTDGCRQFLGLLAQAQANAPKERSAPVVRQMYAAMRGFVDLPEPDGVAIETLSIPGPAGDIAAELYRPGDLPASAPIVLFIHGGGWTIGSPLTHRSGAMHLAQDAGALVVSIDYRLAPEHPFPAAFDDCATAIDWLFDQGADLGGDPARLFVAGDSAGGNLAAVMALRARDRGQALAGQILIYPAVDFGQRFASRDQFDAGYFLEDEDMNWFEGNYIGDFPDKCDPRLSPARAEDHSGLAPAYLLVAECDPLVDEGRHYHAILEKSGVDAELVVAPKVIHGFFNMGNLVAETRPAIAAMGGWVKTRA